ncbi:AGR357Wp [Eremothecium gossypii ATCC 10895]|uniref:asparaginase n=1 Tax=Eremothecium gossypii (strain ATCC 10895 / CBS 109.51 / FGSC 9923 / NRRL Y-1056) TaxID=284811 RepID=Q74Z49_EREGS|nr:AGR357Wp [Eremothecium gossypii ATCC 10895]AAS54847.1 AGR357Wp [Eremothecium gossypii ATCC 10895]AEY99179.1 FAGR357Wp [Eremothecium gossypii FDAG1]
MPNADLEIKTINPDLEASQFIIQPPAVQSGDGENVATDESQRGDVSSSVSSQKSTSLPRIKIIGTGGTIASKGSSSSQTAGYHVDLTIQELLEAIPDISNICEIEYEQLCNVDSKDINEEILLKLYSCISESLQRFNGIVITHGTDTMAETAFFIESTIDSGSVPIVFVGSMRPSTSVSADGPMNLYQAICIASNAKSRQRGVLVSLNDQISSGYYIIKTNANTLDSFNVRQGYLGNFVNNEILYYYPPAKPLGCHKFKLPLQPGQTSLNLPKVVIIYSHQSISPILVELAGKRCKGVVIATMGAGTLPEAVNSACMQLTIPVVYSKRSMEGMVPVANLPLPPSDPRSKIIASGYLNPEKSRILLQLCLNQDYSIDLIRQVFRGVYGG